MMITLYGKYARHSIKQSIYSRKIAYELIDSFNMT